MIWLALLMLWQADPDQARFEQAQQLAAQGRCAEAIPVFQQLLPSHPRLAAIPFSLGQCEFNAKNYLAAVDWFRRALQVDPSMLEAQSLYGAALGLSGRTAEAIVQLRAATRSNSDFAPSFRLLGMFEVEDGQGGSEARSALERAVALDASDDRAHYWLAQLHFANKDYEAAATEYAASLALRPRSLQALLGHARALAGAGRTEEALREFQDVLKHEPASDDASLGAASCYYSLHRFPEALEAVGKAASHAASLRDRRAVLWLLSRLYRVTGEPQKALSNERQLAELEQGMNDSLTRARTLQEQAMRYRASGDYVKLAATLEAVLQLERRQDSLVMLGDAYQALNRPKDAEQCYLRALAAGPELQSIVQRLDGLRAEERRNVQ